MSNDNQVCGAKTRTGGACQSRPLAGATRCRKHGGASPAAQKKAAERLELERLRKEMNMLGILEDGNYETVDPGEVLLSVVSRTAREVTFLESKVAELGDEALAWGIDSRKYGFGPEGVIDETTEKAVPHSLITQLRDARDRLAKYASMALRAGVEERRVALAEREADQLVGSFLRAVATVTLTLEQRDQLQTAFVTELRALEAA